MGVTVVVCAAFGLSPYRRPRLRSRIYVRRGCRSPSQIFSLEAAGQVYNQTNEFIYLWGNVNHNADLVQRSQSAQTQRMAQLSEVHPRTVRPTGRSPRAQNPDAKSRGTQDNAYGCVTWGPRACHHHTLRRAHHSFLTQCIGWRKHNRAGHPIPIWTRLSKREVRAPRRLYARGGSCARDLWRAWRI